MYVCRVCLYIYGYIYVCACVCVCVCVCVYVSLSMYVCVVCVYFSWSLQTFLKQAFNSNLNEFTRHGLENIALKDLVINFIINFVRSFENYPSKDRFDETFYGCY